MNNGAPMSSQATLVGTQARGSTVPTGKAMPPSTVPDETDRRSALRPSARQRRRINVVPPPSSSQPMRMTRARSRSVEAQLATAYTSRSLSRKGKARASLNALPEEEEESDVGLANEDTLQLAGQTNEDEDSADVEAILAVDAQTSHSAAKSAKNNRTLSRGTSVISSDDQRASRKMLRATNRRGPNPASKRSGAELSSDDDEEDFSAILATQPSIRSEPRTHTSAVRVSTRLQQQRASGATSSDNDSIPVAGTKAMTAKRRQIEAQKNLPYIPLLGTRAAERVQNSQNSIRRRLRPRRA